MKIMAPSQPLNDGRGQDVVMAGQIALEESRFEEANEVERQMIQEALRRSSGNIARTAKELGLTRRGLYMKKDRLNFKA